MAQFEHSNVVALVGVVTRSDPYLCVLEYMEHGNLQSWLQNHAKEGIELEQKVAFARDAAAGLAYLHERNFIHRDVAARNLLLDSHMAVKLSDFGMTREGLVNEEAAYYRSRGGAVPVRWTAPEALEEAKFTTASDAWAFGIACYEIMTDGATPYTEGDVRMSNQAVWVRVTEGFRLDCPAGCPTALYKACMLACWAAEPRDRPTLQALSHYLDQMQVAEGDQAEHGTTCSVPFEKQAEHLNEYTDADLHVGDGMDGNLPPPLTLNAASMGQATVPVNEYMYATSPGAGGRSSQECLDIEDDCSASSASTLGDADLAGRFDLSLQEAFEGRRGFANNPLYIDSRQASVAVMTSL
jgi:serine/threonine protein kinase